MSRPVVVLPPAVQPRVLRDLAAARAEFETRQARLLAALGALDGWGALPLLPCHALLDELQAVNAHLADAAAELRGLIASTPLPLAANDDGGAR